MLRYSIVLLHPPAFDDERGCTSLIMALFGFGLHTRLFWAYGRYSLAT